MTDALVVGGHTAPGDRNPEIGSGAAERTEEDARLWLEGRRWPSGPLCPQCGSGARLLPRKQRGFRRCARCGLDFSVRSGTILHRSHLPLDRWVRAMELFAAGPITCERLGKELGVTTRSAWFVLRRLRKACGHAPRSFDQVVEAALRTRLWKKHFLSC